LTGWIDVAIAVIAGHGRSKNGVAFAGLCPAIHRCLKDGCPDQVRARRRYAWG
jgi:hypothetical protein